MRKTPEINRKDLRRKDRVVCLTVAVPATRIYLALRFTQGCLGVYILAVIWCVGKEKIEIFV